MRGGVGLRVEVEDADAPAARGQGRRQIDRRGGLADAALLIDDRDPSHGSFLLSISRRDYRRGGMVLNRASAAEERKAEIYTNHVDQVREAG